MSVSRDIHRPTPIRRAREAGLPHPAGLSPSVGEVAVEALKPRGNLSRSAWPNPGLPRTCVCVCFFSWGFGRGKEKPQEHEKSPRYNYQLCLKSVMQRLTKQGVSSSSFSAQRACILFQGYPCTPYFKVKVKRHPRCLVSAKSDKYGY